MDGRSCADGKHIIARQPACHARGVLGRRTQASHSALAQYRSVSPAVREDSLRLAQPTDTSARARTLHQQRRGAANPPGHLRSREDATHAGEALGEEVATPPLARGRYT
jgi:hypothetical protein